MRSTLATVALMVAHAGCGGGGDTFVRACNDTGSSMTALTWGSYTQAELGAGLCTEYEQPMHAMYRYTNVQFTIGGDLYEIQPIDYAGEEPLGEGHWSYRIGITDLGNHLAGIELEEEQAD